nr:hypothetical protein [Tanacetum cinerariifolium]
REKLLRPQLVGFGNLSKILLVKGIPQDNIGIVVALGTWLATHLTFLSMSLSMEDMCHLVMEEERLLVFLDFLFKIKGWNCDYGGANQDRNPLMDVVSFWEEG